MKVDLPMIKPIPGLPRNIGEMLSDMTDAELIALAGFNPAQTELVATWSDEQLQGIADGTPEGKELEAQLEALEIDG